MSSNNKFLIGNGSTNFVPIFNGLIKEYWGPVKPVVSFVLGVQKVWAVKSNVLSDILPVDPTHHPALTSSPVVGPIFPIL